MKITVGIVTKNREMSLNQTLSSLASGTTKPYEIVIVENDYPKSLASLLRKYRTLKIKYFTHKKPGIADCRNIILEKARGEVIAFVDDDCVLSERWLENLIKTFERKEHTVAVVGKSLNYYPNNKIASLEQDLYIVWISQYINPNKSTDLKSGIFVNTRNFALKKSFLSKIRLKFDNEAPFKIEDTDFGIRFYEKLKSAKLKFIYNPKIVLYHKNSTNIPDFIKRYRTTKYGVKWLLKKYPGFEDTIKRDKGVYKKLAEKNYLARLLFGFEGFIDRQWRRFSRFIKNDELLNDVGENKTFKIG